MKAEYKVLGLGLIFVTALLMGCTEQGNRTGEMMDYCRDQGYDNYKMTTASFSEKFFYCTAEVESDIHHLDNVTDWVNG